ncbi:hypothetical protein KUCAC02_017278, partial [Chaenocephalus aceratus]
AKTRELCVFGDASVTAIAAVAYIKMTSHEVEIAELIVAEIDVAFDNITYYTDSKVVLGYIHNQSRRFYVF